MTDWGSPAWRLGTLSPFKVLERDWESNTFLLDLGGKEDSVSLSRLKAASMPEEAT